MNLREYLRNDWGKNIRPHLIKDKCEFCGGCEELHLHHIDRFHNLLVETLEELQLQELDTEFYDDFELKQISNFMIAKQMRSEYKTLCRLCHMKLHSKEKTSEEYKNNYYNPYGSYYFINVDYFKNNDIEFNMLFRFFMLAVNSNYDGYVGGISGKRFVKYYISDLEKLWNLSRKEAFITRRYLESKGMIFINKDSNIKINSKIITKGLCNYKNRIIIFKDGILSLYNNVRAVEHKRIGLFLYAIMVCIKNNVDIEDDRLKLLYTNITRFKAYYDNSLFSKILNNELIINPSIIWCSTLDYNFKNFIDKYWS